MSGELWSVLSVFRESILCGAIAGAALGFLGVYVVLRRIVFVSAAVTQSAGLGVALAFYTQIHVGIHVDPMVGATVLALAATGLLAKDFRRVRVTRESVVGYVFAMAGGLAVLVGDRITQEAHDIHAILFGSAVLVRPTDLYVVATVAFLILVFHSWWFRGFTFSVFDPITARVHGLPVPFLSFLVLISIGGMAGVSARALGSLPVFAFSTLPAIAAIMLFHRLWVTFLAATLIGALSGAAGFAFSYLLQFPVGASQTVVAGLFVLAAMALSMFRRPAR